MDSSTSFIPKKAITEIRPTEGESVSIFTAIVVIIFLVTALTAGGMFVYQNILQKKLAAEKVTLSEYQSRFSPEQILKMKRDDLRLITATEILARHRSPSQIIRFLQSITFKNVRYTNFEYTDSDGIKIHLDGVARNYQYVGFQSDAFKSNKYVKEYMFSDFALQPDGTVGFKVEATLDPTFIRFDTAIQVDTAAKGVTSTTSGSTIPVAQTNTTSTSTSTTTAITSTSTAKINN